MEDIFTPKIDPKTRPYDIIVKHHWSAKYGDKTLMTIGTKKLNQLPSTVSKILNIYH